MTQFENNLTKERDFTPLDEVRPFYPLLNFTKMIGTSAADVPKDCFSWLLQTSDWWDDLYLQMNNDPSVFI